MLSHWMSSLVSDTNNPLCFLHQNRKICSIAEHSFKFLRTDGDGSHRGRDTEIAPKILDCWNVPTWPLDSLERSGGALIDGYRMYIFYWLCRKYKGGGSKSCWPSLVRGQFKSWNKQDVPLK
jgi:hypothetical protein